MMASNYLSRFLPSNIAPSIYEEMQAEDNMDPWDVEGHYGNSIDEANLEAPLDEYMDHPPEAFGNDSHITANESMAFLPRGAAGRQDIPSRTSKGKGKLHARGANEDDMGDVPASLLIEGDDEVLPTLKRVTGINTGKSRSGEQRFEGVPDRTRWETVQAKQRLHEDEIRPPEPTTSRASAQPLDPRQKALWTWLNASNLDQFMAEVYDYYLGAGVWCICLERFLSLLTLAFVSIFTTFLTQCVDWRSLPREKRLSDALVPMCTQQISGMYNVIIWIVTLWVIWRLFSLCLDVRRLWTMHDFFLHLLNIPDRDMQTISWQEIVGRIMALRDTHPLISHRLTAVQKKFLGAQSRERLDAHDIANRLMRRENYLIALINKDILDLTLPIPFLRGRQIFSRTIQWNISYCILDFMFNGQGQVRQIALKDTHRKQLSAGLRQRFMFAGFMNVILGPFIVSYLAVVYFFKYFNEYYKNPSAIGSRQYTPLAEWKFREFNELQHLFERRINMSYPFAVRYIDQFPKVKTVQVGRFLSFVAGAVVSVLFLTTVIDPELFLAFEITPNRTVLFYLGVFGAIWAAAHGTIPDDNLVFDPEYAIRNVIEYTRYMPSQWEGKLHSDEIKREFSTMYQLKTMIFLEELLSIMLTPFVLWWSLPQCSDRIVDFFREFTVHVDGLGYVCSFAVFDFKKGVGEIAAAGKSGVGAGDALRDDYYSTKHGKMAASFYGFIDNYVTNPKTGIPGHVPPGLRQQQFHPPPSFPGLPMSPTFAADLQQSRMGRSGRPSNRKPNTGLTVSRTPRYGGAAVPPSPMSSMLLDPHHQPSPTIMEKGRNAQGQRIGRSRFLPSEIREDVEEEQVDGGQQNLPVDSSSEPYSGLDESRWETSPTRDTHRMHEHNREDEGHDGGVIHMVNDFIKHRGNGKGVDI